MLDKARDFSYKRTYGEVSHRQNERGKTHRGRADEVDMKPQKAVLRETGRIAAGVAVLTALMLAIYAALGQFSVKALLGGLYSALLAVANFFVMGMTVQSITDEAGERQRSDEEIEALTTKMKARMQTSFTLRKFAMIALLIVGIAVFKFDALATLLPALFPTATIYLRRIFGSFRSNKSKDVNNLES